MDVKMDLSEILLYLDLIKKARRNPDLDELIMMLYFLEDYSEVRIFHNKLKEHRFNPPFVFYNGSLIYFIEDYQDCVDLKTSILITQRNRRRPFGTLFRHQMMLSKSEEEARSIHQEGLDYGIDVGEAWISRYNSMEIIKADQQKWKESQSGRFNRFHQLYNEFNSMKDDYFENLSLKQLKQEIQTKEDIHHAKKTIQTAVYDRRIFIKEYAKRVAAGVCQLCEMEAPFRDKRNEPFLEVHHVHYLSRGGSDTPENAVALCPNCHRKIHQLELESDLQIIKEKALVNLKK